MESQQFRLRCKQRAAPLLQPKSSGFSGSLLPLIGLVLTASEPLSISFAALRFARGYFFAAALLCAVFFDLSLSLRNPLQILFFY